mmetsp:Transcript_33278/g.81699  ORF Transcript_33278/g.81699 Transcript_33278/m.81699 type:complete len:256 (-) Transcript_33278:241-1008(-)
MSRKMQATAGIAPPPLEFPRCGRGERVQVAGDWGPRAGETTSRVAAGFLRGARALVSGKTIHAPKQSHAEKTKQEYRVAFGPESRCCSTESLERLTMATGPGPRTSQSMSWQLWTQTRIRISTVKKWIPARGQQSRRKGLSGATFSRESGVHVSQQQAGQTGLPGPCNKKFKFIKRQNSKSMIRPILGPRDPQRRGERVVWTCLRPESAVRERRGWQEQQKQQTQFESAIHKCSDADIGRTAGEGPAAGGGAILA